MKAFNLKSSTSIMLWFLLIILMVSILIILFFHCYDYDKNFSTILKLTNDIDLDNVGRLRYRKSWIFNEVVRLTWRGMDDRIYYKNIDITTYNQVCKILLRSGKEFTIANFLEEYDKLWDCILSQYRPAIEFNSEFVCKSGIVICATILYAIFLMEVVDYFYFPI